MSEPVLSVSEMIRLMEAMRENAMSALILKQGDFTLSLEGSKAEPAAAGQPPAQTDVACSNHQPDPSDQQEVPAGSLVTSPIVGTFYEAPAPDKPPFVKMGQQVKKGDVLFIIESMKLMNEVLCECDGVVAEVLVENAQPVEYGQPVLRMV